MGDSTGGGRRCVFEKLTLAQRFSYLDMQTDGSAAAAYGATLFHSKAQREKSVIYVSEHSIGRR